VREVLLGGAPGESLLAHLRAGAVVVDMSSSDPVGTRELGSILRGREVALVDALVSGLVDRARAGSLIMGNPRR
jgi:3-hydroxyisobutyrate dehydrogenase